MKCHSWLKARLIFARCAQQSNRPSYKLATRSHPISFSKFNLDLLKIIWLLVLKHNQRSVGLSVSIELANDRKDGFRRQNEAFESPKVITYR